jgi:hypothetical protein
MLMPLGISSIRQSQLESPFFFAAAAAATLALGQRDPPRTGQGSPGLQSGTARKTIQQSPQLQALHPPTTSAGRVRPHAAGGVAGTLRWRRVRAAVAALSLHSNTPNDTHSDAESSRLSWPQSLDAVNEPLSCTADCQCQVCVAAAQGLALRKQLYPGAKSTSTVSRSEHKTWRVALRAAGALHFSVLLALVALVVVALVALVALALVPMHSSGYPPPL